jgi:ribosomal protein S13
MERTMKHSMVMGPERKRTEKEARKREQVRGTVRGIKRKRGLPVRGQRTSTNGKTARRLNAKRISGLELEKNNVEHQGKKCTTAGGTKEKKA